VTAEPPRRALILAEIIAELGCSWCGSAEVEIEKAHGIGWAVVVRHWRSCPVVHCLASPADDVEQYELAMAGRGLFQASYAIEPLVEHDLLRSA